MSIFTKHNSTQFDDALYREAEGLELLRSILLNNGIKQLSVPEVLAVDKHQLSLTSIRQRTASPKQMEILGQGLAALHGVHMEHYGLDQDNYIGLNLQINGVDTDWGEFFIRKRLSVQVSLIRDRRIRDEFEAVLEASYSPLKALLNDSQLHPSLVHGDLWSGNVLFDEDRVWLIDPAVYFADGEVDIAMTEMFGGFSHRFYQAYQDIRPLSDHYPLKREIYNLYHNLNHFNLFGSSYLQACRKAILDLSHL